MIWFRFTRDFDWWGKNPHCVFCQLALWAFKRRDEAIEIPEEAAAAAIAAGAGTIADQKPE